MDKTLAINTIIGLSALRFSAISILDEKVVLHAEISNKTASCPVCGKISRSRHSCYIRIIRDLPMCNKSTYIHLKAKRFFCRNKHCKRVVFCQRSACFLPYGRLTKRATEVLSQIMVEMSARKGAIISGYISLNISASTCLRFVHSLELPDYGQISNLGVDDWALKKGCVYGTALVNMDSGRIVDLLAGRDGDSLSHWLRLQESIKTVNRDRSSSYSSVISKHDPKIEQIADRFHLVKNLSEHVDAIMFSNSRLINKVISFEKSVYTEVKSHGNSRLFAIAKSKMGKGESQTNIAKELGLSRYTIWKYAQMDTFAVSLRRTNIFDKYRTIIETGLTDRVPLSQIHKMIVEAGYSGARSNFYTHFGNVNRNNPFQRSISMKVLSRNMFAKDIQVINNKTERDQVILLSNKLAWITPLNKLCSSFSELLTSGNKSQLDRWLSDAEALNIKRLSRFVFGIRKDYSAVLNAIRYSSSSAVVEGNINRLKTIKRQMYGRASIDLLKRKAILSSSG